MMTSLCTFLIGLMSRWTFLTRVVAAARMESTKPLRLFLEGHRLEGLFFLNLGGRVQARLAEVAFSSGGADWRLDGQSLGRQARGDVFRALDLLGVAVLKHLFRRRGPVHRVCARLAGLAVRVLLLPMSQPAAGAEAHAAPPPGKASVTHI